MTPKQKKIIWDFLSWVWLILFLCTLFLVFMAATAKAETYYVTANSGLNLRWEPSKHSRVEAVAELGEELEVLRWTASGLPCSGALIRCTAVSPIYRSRSLLR